MIDIHTHILYGVDDGAKKIEDSLCLLEEAKKAGFTKIIFTSHYMEEYFTTNLSDRDRILYEINNIKKVDIDLYIGNEIFLTDDIISLLNNKEAISLNDSRYVLFELPFNTKPINLMDVVFKMQSNNIVPILAHPERYSYFYKTPEIYEELVDRGVLLQLNYGSFDNKYGTRARIVAEKILKANLAHFIATDVHKPGTIYKEVPRIIEHLNKLVGEKKVNQLTTINPDLVIEDKEIKIEEHDSIKYNLFEKIKINKK